MSADSRLVLYGVFRALVEERVPLGVADYLDAIRAIRLQLARRDVHTINRAGVRRVCEILWTRTPEEVRLLHRVFDRIAPPDWEEVAAAERLIEPEPPPANRAPAGAAEREDAGGAPERAPAAGAPDAVDGSVSVAFESASETGGIPLPNPVLPARTGATFVLQPQTVMAARAMAVLWRRYRKMTRSGPRTEFDLDATIAARIRRGIIEGPVLRPRRVNRARLLVLADASPSMAPWRPFLATLAQSLVLSRVSAAELWYFANVPRRSLFTTPALTEGRPSRRVFDRYAGAGLLIVSDGGAARGFLNRLRVTQTLAFLADANRRMRSVVWVNPMPAARWEGTTAAALSGATGTTFLPLDTSSMIRAVDVLRGIKAS